MAYKASLSMLMTCILLISISLNACGVASKKNEHKAIQTIRYYPPNYEKLDLPSTRLDLLRFHHTEECEDCFLIGEAVLDILNKEYSLELEQGFITYRVVNSEYLENKPLLMQYGVMEEDFVTHTLGTEVDKIEQHHDLWLITKDSIQLRQALVQIIKERLQLIGLNS
jgi:sortase (surface protein transpeptidase)